MEISRNTRNVWVFRFNLCPSFLSKVQTGRCHGDQYSKGFFKIPTFRHQKSILTIRAPPPQLGGVTPSNPCVQSLEKDYLDWAMGVEDPGWPRTF